MIIKTITAESVAAALKRVRSELGPQAVVLKTRQLENRGLGERVEITACLDNPSPAQSSVALADAKPVMRATFNRVSSATSKPAASVSRIADVNAAAAKTDRITDLERKLDRLLQLNAAQTERISVDPMRNVRERMQDADVLAGLIEETLSGVSEPTADDTELQGAVREHLTRMLSESMVPSITFKPGDRVAFVGPAGSGKTSAMGKLAARLVFQNHLRTTLVSLDDVKVGAFEEIESYADLLGSRVINSHNGKYSFDNSSVTLIDTPSLPKAADRIEHLSASLKTIQPTHCFGVFSALTRSNDIADITSKLMTLRPTYLLMTMLDLTERWGSVITATKTTGLKVAFVTDSAGGIGTLNAPDPALFVRTLLKAEACFE
jgi:flagellar biosynthesis protein FlhF